MTIIGVSYAVAAFPTLARLHARGAQEEFLQYVEAALRHIIFWSMPATIFMIVMRAQIVRIILGSGQFNWDDTRLTAAALSLFVLSLARTVDHPRHRAGVLRDRQHEEAPLLSAAPTSSSRSARRSSC